MQSSVDKLLKFFRLEIERGYDNRAVVGGLDKIIPAWESEARDNRLEEEMIQAVIGGLTSYPNLQPEERAETLTRLMKTLESGVSGAPARVEQNPSERSEVPAYNRDEPGPGLRTDPAERSHQSSRPEPAEGQLERGSPPNSGNAAARQAEPRARKGAVAYGPPPEGGLNAPVRVLPGVGEKIAQTLAGLGLYRLEDMLYHFPRRYDDYSQLKPINRLEYGEETTVLGTIQSIQARPIRGGKLKVTEAVITDGTGFLRVTWFNQPWLATRYTPGSQVVLAGKIDQYLGRLVMSGPEVEPVEAEHLHTNRIVPVYPLTANLTQKNLRRLIHQTVTYWAPRVDDYLPAKVREAVKLPGLSTALLNVHFPESQDMLDVARWRLAFDEIFLLQLGVLRQKRTWQAAKARTYPTPPEWIEQQINRLPFPLTGAQRRALEEIRADLTTGRPMDRLIQGDVGSGKTVVAALTAAMITRHGAQAAIMAPTSILAEQHYRGLTRLLAGEPVPQPVLEADEADASGTEGETQEGPAPEMPTTASAPLQPEQIRLLISDTPEAEKQAIREGLEDGSVKLIIGTHALIESPVQFHDLQLAVIDEQHRFGVAQRATLRAKGQNPHLLVMTATPIPRSLALTVYGDLDLTVMDEMPPGRQPVDTHVLRPVERERAYTLIRSQVEQGRQAFIIYPMIEKNEDGDEAEAPSPNSDPVLTAVDEHKRLQAQVFHKLKIGLLHGKLKPEEKDEVMKAFRDRQYDVLVSTTVVEVGVDIPNASVMLIEGANRFGLAQLHQLRGRVGRGGGTSYCLLIPDKEDAVENERLKVMAETTDGFELAERDLQQRGPGDFLGTRQAGFSELKMASLTDVRLIEKARQQALALFEQDPDLSAPEHQPLAGKLQHFWGGGRGDIS
jgi:ATP-dependent DNA helicase RecG